ATVTESGGATKAVVTLAAQTINVDSEGAKVAPVQLYTDDTGAVQGFVAAKGKSYDVSLAAAATGVFGYAADTTELAITTEGAGATTAITSSANANPLDTIDDAIAKVD